MSTKNDNEDSSKIDIIGEAEYFDSALADLLVELIALKEMSKIVQSLSMLLSEEYTKTYARMEKDMEKDPNFKKQIEGLFSQAAETKDKSFSYQLDKHSMNKFMKVARKSITRKIPRIIGDMSLVYLVAVFENFLKRILVDSFSKKPEALITCQKSLNYEDILKLNDLNEIKESIIEKETAAIVNEDIGEISKYFKQRFSLDISSFPQWTEFKERFYRRNVIVHNSGKPNERYRLKTGYKGKTRRLRVTKEYINESIVLFEAMAEQINSSERKI